MSTSLTRAPAVQGLKPHLQAPCALNMTARREMELLALLSCGAKLNHGTACSWHAVTMLRASKSTHAVLTKPPKSEAHGKRLAIIVRLATRVSFVFFGDRPKYGIGFVQGIALSAWGFVLSGINSRANKRGGCRSAMVPVRPFVG